MLSWLRTTVAGKCYGDYWSNTQTKLICITIAQPKAETVWSGGDRGGWWDEKTTDRVGCLNKLMNSLNEVISVHFCAKNSPNAWTNKSPWTRKLTPKLGNPPVPSKFLKEILRERMWSFVNTSGSHSPHVKIKTHYSRRVQLQLSPFNNKVTVNCWETLDLWKFAKRSNRKCNRKVHHTVRSRKPWRRGKMKTWLTEKKLL